VSTLAVYDCMLFFRAAARPRLARPLFDFVDSGQVTLCLGPEVLAEIRDVLTRPKLVAKYPALTKEAVDAFLAQHLRIATWISHVPEHYVLARDPDDRKYLNLAITAGAPYVVTDDLDLLDVMNPQSAAGIDFRSRFPRSSDCHTGRLRGSHSTGGAITWLFVRCAPRRRHFHADSAAQRRQRLAVRRQPTGKGRIEPSRAAATWLHLAKVECFVTFAANIPPTTPSNAAIKQCAR